MVDDDFLNVDDLMHSDIQSASQEGHLQGRINGYRDGFFMGFGHGYKIASEVGYYKEMTRIWMEELENDQDEKLKVSATARKTLETLGNLIEEFPRENQKDVLFVDLVQRIRAKFKLAASLLRKQQVPSNSSNFSF